MSDLIDDPAWWYRWYGNSEPIGHALRPRFPDRWFRFHSLPGSKRYAENSTDWDELLKRHRSVLSAILECSSPCYVITPWTCVKDSCYSNLNLRLIATLPEFRPDPLGPPTGSYFGTRIAWNFERFEPILREVAEWRTLATVISEDQLVAYAPYDGGADVFMPDSATRDAFRERFKEFLSEHPSGL